MIATYILVYVGFSCPRMLGWAIPDRMRQFACRPELRYAAAEEPLDLMKTLLRESAPEDPVLVLRVDDFGIRAKRVSWVKRVGIEK